MKQLADEKGSSLVYLLWILTATIVLFLILTNIARIYIVKQQASAAAELAALAATGDILSVTEEGIKEYDNAMASWMAADGLSYDDPLWEEIELELDGLVASGKTKHEAYTKVFNEKLPSLLFDVPAVVPDAPPNLKDIVKSRFDTYLASRMDTTVRQIIRENEGNDEPGHVEIVISPDKSRVEVKTDATYDTITDGSLLASFSEDIPQKGYGPPLKYLEKILN
ncbi:pilus assembly protein TadG-related protein [Chungangia koreensis]|uniref:Pilus assembly protein TadG-related protein n=1 Tax=Chungangia koreensis TaxID=752657 RepID=A0ABV8X4G0_9LACT